MSSTTAISPVHQEGNMPLPEIAELPNAATSPAPKISQSGRPGDQISAPASKVKPVPLASRRTAWSLVKNSLIFVAGFAAGSFAHETSLWSTKALPLIKETFSAIANLGLDGLALAAAHPVATGAIVDGCILFCTGTYKIYRIFSPKVKKLEINDLAGGDNTGHLRQEVKAQKNARQGDRHPVNPDASSKIQSKERKQHNENQTNKTQDPSPQKITQEITSQNDNKPETLREGKSPKSNLTKSSPFSLKQQNLNLGNNFPLRGIRLIDSLQNKKIIPSF